MMSGERSLPSIYDGEDEDGEDGAGAPWFLRPDDMGDDDDNPDSSGAPADAATLAEWAAAEQALVQPLAAAARQLGRLEQALADPSTGPGGAMRLALQEAADLLWLEGVRLRPERLWMFRVDAGGDDALARADYVLGLWALERLTGAWLFEDDEALARFLGRRRVDRADDAADLSEDLPATRPALRVDWLAAQAASAALHPLTRAAYLSDLWRRMGPGGREAEVEASVIAARLAAGQVETGAMTFAPLFFGAQR